MKKTGLSIFTSIIMLFSWAQYPAVTIPGSEVRTFTSSIVQGQEYELHVLLPANYNKETQQYPVTYVMDGQWDFPLVKSIYGQQYYDGFIPAMIVVGVTWGGSHANPDSLRVRDYTPTNDGKQKQSGGADQFLKVLQEEIFPFIEKNYRADSSQRNLLGCSLGGLFTIYTMLTHSGMFNGYAAASPAVGWDNGVLSRYLPAKKWNPLNKKMRLFLTVGEVERTRGEFEKFSAVLQAKHFDHLSVLSKVLVNTGHSGTKSETYGRGLQFIYERPVIDPGAALLHSYNGTYQSFAKETITFSSNDHELMIRFGNEEWLPLKASSEKSFYSNQFFLNLQFSSDYKTVQVNRYNNSQLFTRQ